jgi:hypothetical protein
MGMLLVDVYQCAEAGGGALVAAFPGKMNREVCRQIIDYLAQDKIGVLIEAGVPRVPGSPQAWLGSGCHDGLHEERKRCRIVYSPGGISRSRSTPIINADRVRQGECDVR